MEKSLVGENFGARDIREGEYYTNFGDKCPLGLWDTMHVKKPPSGMEKFIGFAAMDIKVRT